MLFRRRQRYRIIKESTTAATYAPWMDTSLVQRKNMILSASRVLRKESCNHCRFSRGAMQSLSLFSSQLGTTCRIIRYGGLYILRSFQMMGKSSDEGLLRRLFGSEFDSEPNEILLLTFCGRAFEDSYLGSRAGIRDRHLKVSRI